jgi:hypothetical protein
MEYKSPIDTMCRPQTVGEVRAWMRRRDAPIFQGCEDTFSQIRALVEGLDASTPTPQRVQEAIDAMVYRLVHQDRTVRAKLPSQVSQTTTAPAALPGVPSPRFA